MLILSGHTPDAYYTSAEPKFKASMERFGLPYTIDIWNPIPGGPYHIQLWNKPVSIHRHLFDIPEGDWLIWVDIDMEIVDDPFYLLNPPKDHDLMFPFINGDSLQTSIIGLRRTPANIELVKSWICYYAIESYRLHPLAEQHALIHLLNMKRIPCFRLPESYDVDTRRITKNPTVLHYHYSRKFKGDH